MGLQVNGVIGKRAINVKTILKYTLLAAACTTDNAHAAYLTGVTATTAG